MPLQKKSRKNPKRKQHKKQKKSKRGKGGKDTLKRHQLGRRRSMGPRTSRLARKTARKTAPKARYNPAQSSAPAIQAAAAAVQFTPQRPLPTSRPTTAKLRRGRYGMKPFRRNLPIDLRPWSAAAAAPMKPPKLSRKTRKSTQKKTRISYEEESKRIMDRARQKRDSDWKQILAARKQLKDMEKRKNKALKTAKKVMTLGQMMRKMQKK